ncbi:MAG: hypothetical protein INR70_33690 [Parafilimonas terrae]|jgi:hypothetical protein|nr:hypothetical protein [Parafilimonas terrae]
MPRSSHARSSRRAFKTLLVRPRLGGAALSGQSAKSGAAGHGAREAAYLGGDRTVTGSPLIPSKVHA